MDNSQFIITGGKGFRMTFANGWTVSVQWGKGNYCDNYTFGFSDGLRNESESVESSDAEIAAWDSDGKWYDFDCDKVQGYQTTTDVLSFLNKIAAM